MHQECRVAVVDEVTPVSDPNTEEAHNNEPSQDEQ